MKDTKIVSLLEQVIGSNLHLSEEILPPLNASIMRLTKFMQTHHELLDILKHFNRGMETKDGKEIENTNQATTLMYGIVALNRIDLGTILSSEEMLQLGKLLQPIVLHLEQYIHVQEIRLQKLKADLHYNKNSLAILPKR